MQVPGSNLASSLRIKLANKINLVKFIANTLVILGLIGTVIGFIIALSGVDGGVSSDPEEISKMITTLIQGMSVALYTTLAGSICSVWLNICYHILSSGANKLLAKIIEIGEVKNLMLDFSKENQIDEVQSDTVFRDVTLLASIRICIYCYTFVALVEC